LSDYLLENWGVEVTQRVKQQIDTTVKRIAESPEQFPVFLKKKKVYRCIVTPQTSIFFEVTKHEIVITTIFDNRQSPRKLKL
jgi:plasmid stabilization system protein ParE